MLNDLFMKHHIDYFIVHSSKGYKKTKSREEIIDSLEENHKRAMNLLRKERKVKRALLENGNLSFGW
jgi:Fe2+ or Zn2+ uptake regulation protein